MPYNIVRLYYIKLLFQTQQSKILLMIWVYTSSSSTYSRQSFLLVEIDTRCFLVKAVKSYLYTLVLQAKST